MKIRKRFLSLLLVLILLLTQLCLPVSAKDPSGDCGDSAKWTLSSSGVLTISGTGAIRDYIYSGANLWPNIMAPWRDHEEKVTKIVIEAGITRIGDNAFCCLPNVTSVSIPDTVTYIGQAAFCDDKKLDNVVVPDSVTEMEQSVFKRCSALTNIKLSEKLTYIPGGTFESCSSLRTFTFPSKITELRGAVFKGCGSLESIVVPEGIKTIESQTFAHCGLSSIRLPDSLEKISVSAFYGCKLTQIIIPKNVKSILNDAFGMSQIKKIYFTGDIPNLNLSAFSSMSATIYYPQDNETWIEELFLDYGGNVTYEAYSGHIHSFGAWKTTQEATCTQPGIKTRTCTECNTPEQETIAQLTHKYQSKTVLSDCTKGGYTTYTCKLCKDSYKGETIPAGDHDYGGWVWIVEPFEGVKEAVKERVCKVCKMKDTVTVPIDGTETTPPVTQPNTSATTPPATESAPAASEPLESTGATQSTPSQAETAPPSVTTPKSDNSTVLIIIGITAAVAIIGGAVWFFLRKRK